MFTPYTTFEEYLAHETFAPILPVLEENVAHYKRAFEFLNKNLLRSDLAALEEVVLLYNQNYEDCSELLDINELIDLYNECGSLLHENNQILDKNYTDADFMYNGFIKSEFVIHAHDSKRAPFHYDLRFLTEFGTSAYSFAIPKHKMPEGDERILAKEQPTHPPQWVAMDHTQIGEGYGQGSVSTVDRGTIYYKRKDKSFNLYLCGKIYNGAYHLINIRNSLFLLFRAQGSILVDSNERMREWISYASSFLSYLRKTFDRKFEIKDLKLNLVETQLSFDEYDKISKTHQNVPIPPIELCIELEQKNEINKIISKECNIRNIEDVMRLLILRKSVAPMFFGYLEKRGLRIDDVYDDIREVPYVDPELELLKSRDFAAFKIEKVHRMFSDIYLGHKFYGQFDFERYLMKKVSGLTQDDQNNQLPKY